MNHQQQPPTEMTNQSSNINAERQLFWSDSFLRSFIKHEDNSVWEVSTPANAPVEQKKQSPRPATTHEPPATTTNKND